ncbi:hypothetical protein NHQ30_005233 [Ciborinia camelliae]|nr:hypothetical protein NHQ30_005233 [Ciborinia camelliae]
MQFSNLLTVVVGLLATAEAVSIQKPRLATRTSQKKVDLKYNQSKVAAAPSTGIQNFTMHDIVTRSAIDKSNGTTIYNDSIHFVVTDPNSNSSSVCNDDFQGTVSITQSPTGWVPCNSNGILMDNFFWQFTEYYSLTKFTIQIIHGFVGSDNYGEVLKSAATPVELDCTESHMGCFSSQEIPVQVIMASA